MEDQQVAPKYVFSGGLVFLLLVFAVIAALHWDNRQWHNHRQSKVVACETIQDSTAKALCVVAVK